MPSIAAKEQLPQTESASLSKLTPWLVCFSAALFFFFIFIQLNMFNAIGSALTKDFGVDAAALANISDKYFLANIIFLFPAGMLLDRVSTRKIVIASMLISIICTFAFGLAETVWQMKLARFMTGVVGSFCLLSCVRLASRWFPPHKMALVIGLIITLAMIGGMVAQTPLDLLTKFYGWRSTVMIDAIFGVGLLLMIILFVKDNPGGSHQADPHPALRGKAFRTALFATLGKRQNWFAGLYASLMNLPVFLLGAIWGIFYLTEVRHLASSQASWITSMLFFGVIIGSPVVGWWSDHICKRKLPMLIGAIGSLLVISVIMFAPQLSLLALFVLFFALGFMSSSQIISYPLIAESNSLSMTATAEGVASVLIMAGGFSQVFFADLMQLFWNHHYVHGVPIYSAFDFRVAMAIMPVAFVISLVLVCFIRETHGRSSQ